MDEKKQSLGKELNIVKPGLAEIAKVYRSAFEEHGVSPASLLWSKGKQKVRFEVLCAPWNIAGKKILDVGCGFADLYQFLTDKGISVDYTGIELLPEFVQIARRRYPDAKIIEGDFLEALSEQGEKFDVAIASGTFNVLPQTVPLQAYKNYVLECIRKMVEVSRQGVSVDFQSTYNIDFRYSTGFYLSPTEALDLCLLRFGRIALRHDYFPYEYAVFIFKDNEIIKPLNVFREWEELARKKFSYQ